MTCLRGTLFLGYLALLGLCASPARALAQQPTDDVAIDPPAHVSYVDGAATLERDGRPDASPLNMPLLAGDRVRTQNGRVEILFGDGSILHLDANTVVDFQSDELVRLLNGRVRLAIPGTNRSVSYRIDAPWASAQIAQSGEYRLAILPSERGDEIELAVIRGAAELVNEQGRTPLRAGERALARANVAPSYSYVYNSAAWDAFDRWSEARRDERLGVSTQYLPEDVRPYAASFDRYGSWRYEPSYGNVWYPRVDVGWRPYYNGRWATLRPYGWTWIGADPWAWPTHHYGRWGFSADVWFWIPGRSWGPAWVSWAYAPGYVSWCPLGWNNRPVIQIVNLNIHNRGYDPWRAWTVLPQRHFNAGYVNVRTVGRFDLDARTRTSFSQGNRGPAYGGYAVPRASAPIRVAGTGRRTATSPLYTNLEPRDSRVGNAPSRTVVGPPARAPREQRTPGYAAAPDAARVPAARRRTGDVPATMTAPDRAVAPERSAPAYQDRSGYGRIERAPSRSAVPRDGRSYGAAPVPPARPGADMGVGGGWSSPRRDDAPAPAYDRPTRERRGDAVAPGAGTGRAVPRDRSDSPAYRPAAREPRGPDAAPPRASTPEPRGRDRAPAADRPSGSAQPRGSGHVRPGGSAPTSQARPRGGRGGDD